MIYSSNHLEYLCQTLAGNIGQKNGNIFAREVIITQSAGMTAWLKTELATRNGVFANTGLMNQDTLLNEIYLLLTGVKPQNNKDLIRFKVYKLLGGADFKGEFPGVAGYFNGSDLRRVQLSGRIADLFDQYQLYRADMIRLWEENKMTKDPSDAEKWQKWLWENLKIESRVTLRDNLIILIEKNKELISKTYPGISLFGITIFTEFHLVFFRELSKYTKVDFYLCLPTESTDHKNELLLSFGSKAEELAKMVAQNLGKFEFVPERNIGNTSLIKIQDQILNNSSDLAFTDDGSLQINSCFTPVREVECLYNYLLDLFERDRTLKPGDVLVMATDINKYSPFVKAVFKNAPVNIPFSVSGAANNSEDSMVSAIEQILRFTEDDLTSEKVVSLLEQKRIKQRFRVSDCDYIRSVVRKANIRFGRENRAEDDTRYVSWKYGLEKILLGYAMHTDMEYPVGDDLTLYPYRDAEASESHDLFRLKAFVDTIESVIDEEGNPRTMAAWKLFLEDVLERMVYHNDFDKDDRAELTTVRKALSYIANLEFDEIVPFQVFLEELESKLFTESGEMKLNTGNITVSAPVPVRGIPFRVICFLGLGNGAFPRKDNFAGFDLLGEGFREGDRNKKETDKYLFLDTILSSREKLYLSYIGQNVKDNTGLPPSIIVDTFLDYIDTDKLPVKHPLHGFSSVYQKEDSHLFTYLYADNPEEFYPKETAGEKPDEVPLYSFVKFFEHPVNWYFDSVLGIRYEDNNDTLPETELFNLDNLEKWARKTDLLMLEDGEAESYLQQGIKEGLLPLKNLGRVMVDELAEEIAEARSKYQSLTIGIDEQNIAIDIMVDMEGTENKLVRITGNIGNVFNGNYIFCSLSRSPHKNQVRAYLRTLLLCSQGEIISSVFIDKTGETSSYPVLSPEESKSRIRELLIYFRKGTEAPLKFTLEAFACMADKSAVENIFKGEAEGNVYSDKSPNRNIGTLLGEGYFKEFDVKGFDPDEFDPEIYQGKVYDEIKDIAGLLNLKRD